MKALSVMGFIAFTLFALRVAPVRAQSEIDPDHFDSANPEAIESGNKSVSGEALPLRYQGTFKLQYAAECNGKRLAPGDYTVSLRGNGKEGQVILQHNGHTVGFAGEVRPQNHTNEHDALLVKIHGKTRTLCVIQMAQMEVVLEPKLKITKSSTRQSERTDRVPVTMVFNTN